MLSNGARSGRKNWRDNIVTTELTGNKLDEVEVVQTQANGVETRSDLGVGCSVPIFVLYSGRATACCCAAITTSDIARLFCAALIQDCFYARKPWPFNCVDAGGTGKVLPVASGNSRHSGDALLETDLTSLVGRKPCYCVFAGQATVSTAGARAGQGALREGAVARVCAFL